MANRSLYRGVYLMLVSTGIGALAFVFAPMPLAYYIVVVSLLTLLIGLAIFYRDFARNLKR